MPRKTDKNILKQYFRSGSRPTQKQFHELIDNCYNDEYSTFVSGYQLQVNLERNKTNSVLKREKGKTTVIPFFERINTPQQRIFNYAIPVFNLGEGFILEKILMEMNLPGNAEYSVKDKQKDVQIEQKVLIEKISVFNGSDKIFSTSPEAAENGPAYKLYRLQIDKASKHWKGIGIDIVIRYEINSDIAVSDQLDISKEKPEMLEHTFGSAGCVFNPSE